MKKILNLLLVVCLLVSFAGCGERKNNNINTGLLTENKNSNVETTMDAITSVYRYSEGYAFIQTNNNQEELHCIDKKGNIIFTLNGDYTNIIGFHNGIAVMKNGQFATACLCDTKGNITMPEDIGATEFLLDDDDKTVAMFEDGYILAIKNTTDFSGSKNELGIYNSNLELIVNFSEKLYSDYQNHYYSYQYYDGYLFDISWNNRCVDLRTGVDSENTSEMFAKIKPKYESDMWETYSMVDRYEIYDIREGEDHGVHKTVIDLSKYAETIFDHVTFRNGIANVTFNSGEKWYFTILKEDGEFAFEPIEIETSTACYITQSNGNYLIESYKTENGVVAPYKYIVFDVHGKRAEIDADMVGYVKLYLFSDDVIIAEKDGVYSMYDTNFKPLF